MFHTPSGRGRLGAMASLVVAVLAAIVFSATPAVAAGPPVVGVKIYVCSATDQVTVDFDATNVAPNADYQFSIPLLGVNAIEASGVGTKLHRELTAPASQAPIQYYQWFLSAEGDPMPTASGTATAVFACPSTASPGSHWTLRHKVTVAVVALLACLVMALVAVAVRGRRRLR